MTETLRDQFVRPVVLAGGGSARFADGNKAFATIDGRPLLACVVLTVEAATGVPPVIAVRSDDQRRVIQAEITGHLAVDPIFVTDNPAFRGPLAGVFAACSVIDLPWLFLVGCDMPLLDSEVVSWLCERCRESSADAIVPREEDGLEPLHALYRRASLDAVRERVDHDDGVHSLIDGFRDVDVVSSRECPKRLDRSARNVNTVADLEAIRSHVDGMPMRR